VNSPAEVTKMIALVTGANKGIGREIAAQLAGLGHTAVIASRNAQAGDRAAAELREAGQDAVAVVLDVTDPASAAAAAATVGERFGRLDALVNNAGISHLPGRGIEGQQPATADVEEVRAIFETNFFGVINVTSAFLPLLRRSPAPRIVNVSSSGGSLTKLSDLGNRNPVAIGYAPSKTALTALTLQYAKGLAAEHILVNAVDPGFVATGLNNFAGVRTPAQGAAAAVRMAAIPADGPTGTFTDDQGAVPW
jgi:NAD(P)-dependent dehydrogenase (short-subunit alcohol dehydrogenase family)